LNTQQFIPNSLEITVDSFKTSWVTPSNIALVKYWGKTEPQMPKNASISFTLSNCKTETTINFTKNDKGNSSVEFDVFFEGEKKEAFKPKIAKFFERIEEYCPYLKDYSMKIESSNSFPHSSGIASSASGMSAIAMCIMSLEKEFSKKELSKEYVNKKASFLARLGSGSACRSLEGPLVVWGQHEAIPNSSDLYGVQFPFEIHSNFKNYQDAILLVDKGEKQVSSTVGHNLMHNHPFAEQRFQQANDNLTLLTEVLKDGDLDKFIEIVESEALSLHAMMLTSNPYFILMRPNTLKVIETIWKYRKETGSKVCFTLDAGANVHVLYPENEKDNVLFLIKERLSSYCQKKHYICDNVGLGAYKK